MREKVIVYGAGNNFIFSHYELSQFYDCVGLVDGDINKLGTNVQGMKVQTIEDALANEYEFVVLTPANVEGISSSLIEKGVPADKIIDLQEAFDRIPEDSWHGAKHIEGVSGASKVGIILYGGMGDLLVAKLWLEKLIRIYELDTTDIYLFLSNQNLRDAKLIFSDVVSENNMQTIDDYSKVAAKGEYAITLRFCIIPEVFEIRNTKSDLFDTKVGSYIRRLDEECSCNYNRGFFTTKNYCNTIRTYLVERNNKVYHTAYDIWSNLKAEPSDKTSTPLLNTNEGEYLAEVGLTGKKYITINTGVNQEYSSKRNTREWDFNKWNDLAVTIKTLYPEVKVVQVGLKLKEADDIEADIHLNGKTNLEQISVVLKNAIFHIDYDGGLVHVNHMVGGKSIVLMGPSETSNHAYHENLYVSSGECEACEWTTPDWLSRCPLGDAYPRCMKEITVEKVIDAISEFIER